MLLFSESARTLVHHHWVFGRGVAHASLRWKFLAKLRAFTVRVGAKAALRTVSGTLRNIRPHDQVDDSPQCKSCPAVSPIIRKYLLVHAFNSRHVHYVVFRCSSIRYFADVALAPLRWSATPASGVLAAVAFRQQGLCVVVNPV